uniref:Putative DNA binding, helix-turn-helix domain containing protein n=1 Tax=viral metagenome TaxID=1070528 RepID=A0A6M3ISE8_9ZZZZ
MEKDVLLISEVADYLNVSKVTIKRYIKSGKIPAIHLSHNVVRILKSDITNLFTKGTDGSEEND